MRKLSRPSVFRLLGLGAALAVFSACGETLTDPQPLDSELLLQSAVADAGHHGRGRPVLAASGRGQAAVTVPLEEPNLIQDPFSFDARKGADGIVAGRVKVRNVYFAPNNSQSGDVTCMTSFGASGIVAIGADIPAPDPDNHPPGTMLFFMQFVRDNGEVANARQDQLLFGHLTLPDFLVAEEVCQFLLDLEAGSPGSITGFVEFLFADIDSGNIKVLP